MQPFANQAAHELGHLKSLFDRIILAFIAPQGAGKQVVSSMYQSIAPFEYVEAGAAFDGDGELAELKKQGLPIPNSKFLPAIRSIIQSKSHRYGGIIYDGPVRFPGQGEIVTYGKEAGYTKGVYVVELQFSSRGRGELVRRIIQRGREDDKNPRVVQRRLEAYYDNLPLVIQMYKEHQAQFIYVNGNQEHEIVFAQSLIQLCAKIKNI